MAAAFSPRGLARPGDGGGSCARRRPGFTARVTNPYYPLLPGMRWEYRGVKDGRPLRDVVVVTKRVERIGGVPCAVVIDRAYVDGRLAESTIDWFAQDGDGTVWYFGEAHAGARSPGPRHEHARAPGAPAPTAPGRASSCPRARAWGSPSRRSTIRAMPRTTSSVVSRTATIARPLRDVPGGALMTEEWTPLEPGVRDAKWYVKGIGQVKEATLKGGDERAELVSFRRR